MESAVEEWKTRREHLRQAWGWESVHQSNNQSQRVAFRNIEKSRIILPLYFKSIDKAMSISLLQKNVRSNLYETDYIAFLEDVRLLATNAEKYNGIADVVTNAAWELYKIAEKYHPYKIANGILSGAATRRPVCPSKHKSSAGAGSSGALPLHHGKKAQKTYIQVRVSLQIIKKNLRIWRKKHFLVKMLSRN